MMTLAKNGSDISESVAGAMNRVPTDGNAAAL